VKRAWHKNLLMKVKNPDVRYQMWTRLPNLMQGCPATEEPQEWIEQEVSRFCADFQQEQKFLAYFAKEWGKDKLGEFENLELYPHHTDPSRSHHISEKRAPSRYDSSNDPYQP
jgi:hypothetical protein